MEGAESAGEEAEGGRGRIGEFRSWMKGEKGEKLGIASVCCRE